MTKNIFYSQQSFICVDLNDSQPSWMPWQGCHSKHLMIILTVSVYCEKHSETDPSVVSPCGDGTCSQPF